MKYYYPNSLIFFYCLTIPFSAFGFYLGPLLFSISFIPVFIINILTISKFKLKKSLFIKYLIFFTICFFSSYYRHSFSSFLPALIVFSFLLFPFLSTYRFSNTEKYIKISFIFLSIYCFFELMVGILSTDIMFEIEKALNIQGSTTTYRGIRRLRGGFLEPSVMGIALNFYLMIFVYSKTLKSKVKIFYVIVNIFWIILTFSSSAYAALIINITFFIIIKLKNLNLNFKINFKSLYVIFFLIITFFISKNYFFEPIYKAFEKLSLIPTVIMFGDVTGSVGYRINSLIVAPMYIYESGIYEKLFGTGFSNYSEYIISKFGSNEFSGFSDGSIGNIFSAILLSTGLLGFTSFIVFIKEAIYLKNTLKSINLMIITGIAFVAFGDLTSPWIWGLIFLTKLCFESNIIINEKN